MSEKGITQFQLEVFRLTSLIPAGKFSTYAALSNKLNYNGIKSSPIAVGQALKRNRDAPNVPCHRVVSSSLKLGGYSGVMQSELKLNLLLQEGVQITDWVVTSKHLFFDFTGEV